MKTAFRSVSRLAVLALSATLAAPAQPVISEFMAANSQTLADEERAMSDWIEIHNPTAAPISLAGWHLTDNPTKKTKWAFPDVSLPANSYLVVFASGRDRRDPANPLHTNFSLDADGEYLALIAPDGISASTEFTPKFPPQCPDVSYGQPHALAGAAGMAYLERATPWTANTGADAAPISRRVEFSRRSGPFTGTFELALGGAVGDEHIRYVAVPVSGRGALDAIEPTAASPLYLAPLRIDQSIIIRAAIFSSDDQKQGASRTVHYLKQESVTARSALPAVVVAMHGYGDLEENGTRFPGWVHVFDPGPTPAALMNPPVTASAGMLRIRGNSSALYAKKGYNVELLGPAGGENREPLLGLAPSDSWAIVAPWSYDRAYVRNAFVYTLSNRIGRWAPQSRFVEVYYDGSGTLEAADYAGVSLLTERVKISRERLNLAELPPDAPGDITGGYLLKIDVPGEDDFTFITDRGIPSLDSAAVVVVSPKAERLPPAQRDYIRGYVQTMENALFAGRESSWRDRSYTNYVDLPSWIDYHLLQVFSANIDGLTHSFYFHKDRGGKLVAGPVWDFDRALGSYDPRTRSPEEWDGGPVDLWDHGWYGVMARDPEFMQAWIDRWQSLRSGEFSTTALLRLVGNLAAAVTAEAAARDAARWVDNVSPTGMGFVGEIARLNTWLTQRAAWIDRQFVPPPAKTESAGILTFTAPAGALLAYTLDGSDPRAFGGGIAANARFSETPLRLQAPANVHVRSYNAALEDVFPGSPWSSAAGGTNSSPLTPRSRLVNLSTSGPIGASDDALIAGVVIADAPTKRYLVRGIGPGLAAFGTAGTITDPQVSVVGADGRELYRNRGWQSASDAAQLPGVFKAVGAFPLVAGGDSALTADLPAGGHTVQVTSSGDDAGVGLAELYELDTSGRTVNLSTRARVGTGDRVLIGGFVVQGGAHQRLLLRAAGPSLAGFGVAGALSDPMLTVYAGSTVVASSTQPPGEADTMAAANAATVVGGFQFAKGSGDAAILVSLPPGAYTVEVKSRSGAEGVALLEIYDVP
ncbi:MAG: CotH kinase family protein [Opitutaceae bacterium]|nr:CotH kinase family protein [Opitutaceae bacterium]